MAEVVITIPLPAWLADKAAELAQIAETSTDDAVCALLAREVVHT